MAPRCDSEVWRHFVEDDKDAKCRYCGVKIKKAVTSNMRRHLQRFHRSVVPKTRKPVSISTASSVPIDPEITSEPVSDDPIPGPSIVTVTRQDRIDQHFPVRAPLTTHAKHKLDNTLMRMICREYFPFSIVEGEDFREFIYLLNPNYQPPCRKTLSKSLLPSLYNQTFEKIKDTISSVESVALTSDGWTNINNVSFFAVTVHFISNEFKLTSFMLECGEFDNQHTGKNIAEWLKTVLSKFEIPLSKVSAITTDNASNMKTAANELNIRHFSCFAHSLNLVVQHAIQDSIQEIVENVKSIVMFFKKSSSATLKLTQLQESLNMEKLKLKQYVVTRWNSTYDMLDRFSKNRVAIGACFDSLKKNCNISNDQWHVIEETVKVLSHFNQATQTISAEKSITISKVGLLIQILVDKLTNITATTMTKEGKQLIAALIKGMDERFKTTRVSIIVQESMILDPRIKHFPFQNDLPNYKKIRESIINKVAYLYQQDSNFCTETPPLESRSQSHSIFTDFISQVNNARDQIHPKAAAIAEFDHYIKARALNFEADPLIWWKEEQHRFPKLYIIAKKKLHIPATSVPCKRIFSKAGQIYTEKRNRLEPKKLNEILFLQHNMIKEM